MTYNSSTLTTLEESFLENVSENVDFIYHRIDNLMEKDKEFIKGLIKYYGKTGSFSPKQLPYIARAWDFLNNQNNLTVKRDSRNEDNNGDPKELNFDDDFSLS